MLSVMMATVSVEWLTSVASKLILVSLNAYLHLSFFVLLFDALCIIRLQCYEGDIKFLISVFKPRWSASRTYGKQKQTNLRFKKHTKRRVTVGLMACGVRGFLLGKQRFSHQKPETLGRNSNKPPGLSCKCSSNRHPSSSIYTWMIYYLKSCLHHARLER